MNTQYYKRLGGTLLIFVFLYLAIQYLPINITKIRYPDITLTIYDQDWHGSPYAISEVTTHRWYEKGQIGKNNQGIENKIKESNFDFTLSIYDYQNQLFTKDGNDNQLCITQDFLNITQISSSFLSTEYLVSSNSRIDFINTQTEYKINDYGISFKAKLKVTGVFSNRFVEDQVQELYLQSSLSHLADYFKSRQRAR